MKLIGRLRILSAKPFPLPGTNNKFTHLATITDGLREFIYIKEEATLTTYIEEITGGRLNIINDDELWKEIAALLGETGLTQVGFNE